MKIIKMNSEQYKALEDAILAGALAARHSQLTVLLRNNAKNYPSIANGNEAEIQALIGAAAAVLAAEDRS